MTALQLLTNPDRDTLTLVSLGQGLKRVMLNKICTRDSRLRLDQDRPGRQNLRKTFPACCLFIARPLCSSILPQQHANNKI
jgi:hypothetical protein